MDQQPQELDMMTRTQTGSVLWKLSGAEASQLQADQLISLARLIMSYFFGSLMALFLVLMTAVIFCLCIICGLMALILVGPVLVLRDWIRYQTQGQANQLQNLPGPDGDVM